MTPASVAFWIRPTPLDKLTSMLSADFNVGAFYAVTDQVIVLH